MYFLVIKDPRYTDKIVFKTPPLRFNKESGFENLLLPAHKQVTGDYQFTDSIILQKDFFLESTIDILNYVTHFPLRTLKNLKISKGPGEYLIYTVNTKHLNQGWFGITITDAKESDLPIIKETKLGDRVYDHIASGFKKRDVEFGDLARIFGNYCIERLSGVLEGMWRQNSLEQVITPKKGDSTKWDLFLTSIEGLPLTNIIRYDSRLDKIFTLNMNRSVNIDEVDNLIETIHYHNCASLSGCYNVCKNNCLGELKHMSSILANGKGYGFTFLDELTFTNKNFMNPSSKSFLVNLDVKNRRQGNNKYINKLYGNEQDALLMIKQEIEQNKVINQYINSLNKGKVSPTKLDDELKIILKKIVSQ